MLNPDSSRETLLFLAKLTALSIPLYLVIWLGIDLTYWQAVVTSQSSSLLNLFGVTSVANGTELLAGGERFLIVADCTGWKSMLFLFGLTFATGAALRQKLAGLALGLPVLWALNIARVSISAWASLAWGMETGMLLHDIAWQLALVIGVVLLWAYWLRWRAFISEKGTIMKRVRECLSA